MPKSRDQPIRVSQPSGTCNMAFAMRLALVLVFSISLLSTVTADTLQSNKPSSLLETKAHVEPWWVKDIPWWMPPPPEWGPMPPQMFAAYYHTPGPVPREMIDQRYKDLKDNAFTP